MCAATETPQLEQQSIPSLIDALNEQAGKLPIEHILQSALMQIAAKRLLAVYSDIENNRAVPGWAGWSQVAPGWLLRISEDDDGVWLYACKPVSLGEAKTHLEHSAAFRAAPDSRTAQCLRKFRKALRELL